METHIIVSRHPATIAWLKEKYGKDTQVIEHLTAAQITAGGIVGAVIYHGNLPPQLAYLLPFFYAIEFEEFPPRGVELTPQELETYGIREVKYSVRRLD